MKGIKYIKRQDSGWKQQFGYSGETSINLSNELCEFLTYGLISEGEEINITFLIYRKDYYIALEFIKSQIPLYRSTSRTCILIDENSSYINKLQNSIDSFFGDEENAEYVVTLYRRRDGRIYLKGLKQKGFTIRDFLVENASAISFENNDGIFILRVLSEMCEP